MTTTPEAAACACCGVYSRSGCVPCFSHFHFPSCPLRAWPGVPAAGRGCRGSSGHLCKYGREALLRPPLHLAGKRRQAPAPPHRPRGPLRTLTRAFPPGERGLSRPGRPPVQPSARDRRAAQPTMPCGGSASCGFRSTTLAAAPPARPRPATARLLRDWPAVLLVLPSLLSLALFRLSLEDPPSPVTHRDPIGHFRDLPAASCAGWFFGLSVGAVTRQRVRVRLFPRQ